MTAHLCSSDGCCFLALWVLELQDAIGWDSKDWALALDNQILHIWISIFKAVWYIDVLNACVFILQFNLEIHINLFHNVFLEICFLFQLPDWKNQAHMIHPPTCTHRHIYSSTLGKSHLWMLSLPDMLPFFGQLKKEVKQLVENK